MPWRNGWEPGAGVVARRGVDRLVFVDCLAALGLQERLGQGGRSRLGLGEGQHPPTFPNAPEVVNATGTSSANIGGHHAAAPYFETI